MTIETMKLALESCEAFLLSAGFESSNVYAEVIAAIKQAEKQEPVWIQPNHLQKARQAPFLCRVEPAKRDDFVPLYTAPPKRKWKGLTDEEIYAVIRPLCNDDTAARMLVESSMDEYRAIEAKLKEKNT